MDNIIHVGKAKTVYRTDDPTRYVIKFRDDITAFDGKRKAAIPRKGYYNAQISARLFELLESHGIATHFLEMLDDTRMLVKAVDIIPLEIIVRNIAAGSLVRKYPFKEGQKLKPPVIVTDFKSDSYGDPMINGDLIRALRLATGTQVTLMRERALKVNLVLKEYLEKRGLLLPDFKLEFGTTDEQLLVADEISCDTCRLWLKDSRQSLDKDIFRYERGDLITAYEEAAKRILA
ncbi:MAG: phosphoribosylaminoimidazolesuccinocarboxamide synthase [Halobacteriota archaeon]